MTTSRFANGRLTTRRFTTLLPVMMLSAIGVITGCGGGGGSATPVTPVTPGGPIGTPPPIDALMGGIWVGVMNFEMAMGSELAVAIMTDDGRFRFLTDPTLTQFVGNQQIDINDVVGGGFAYVADGGMWPDGSAVTVLSIDGTLTERDTFSGTWSTSSGESGDFEFFYDTVYEIASSLPLLEGVYSVYDDAGAATATFTVNNDGSFTGQNTFGCISSGQISIIDPTYNVYQVDSTISGCAIAGDYSGLAVLGENNVPNDSIALTISNDVRSIYTELEK